MNKLIPVLLLIFLSACSADHSDPITSGVVETTPEGGTDTGDGTDDSNNTEPVALSFEKDIFPIVEQRCVLCHNETSGLPDWRDYDTTFANRDKINNRVVILKNMPLGNQTQMTQEERDIFMAWIDQGALL